jgi:CheY-like chemotaxis protein
MKNPEHLRPDTPDQSVILVVEDDVMVLNIVRISLEKVGYFVLTAEDGEEALYLSRHYPGAVDLLVSDIDMPVMSGLELGKRITQERHEIRVLLMSGHFHGSSPYPVLRKPFSPNTLCETVKGLLPARQEERKRA